MSVTGAMSAALGMVLCKEHRALSVNEARATCYHSYLKQTYEAVDSDCKTYADTLVPELNKLNTTRDPQFAASLEAEMFHICEMTSKSYRHLGKDNPERRYASYTIRWYLMYYDAMEATDKPFQTGRRNDTMQMVATVQLFRSQYPSVYDEQWHEWMKGLQTKTTCE